jgi:hypothetical protein
MIHSWLCFLFFMPDILQELSDFANFKSYGWQGGRSQLLHGRIAGMNFQRSVRNAALKRFILLAGKPEEQYEIYNVKKI